MPTETLTKFGYPENLLAEYEHWAVLLRPKQVTAGSLVLACTDAIEKVPDLSIEAFAELKTVTTDLEAALRSAFAFDKINYLLLMMVDRYVHFHVIPRYESDRVWSGVVFKDAGWPKHPALDQCASLNASEFADLRRFLRSRWPRPETRPSTP
ncbi:MAG: HIT family protein [Thermoanaerobaculia bacterium]|nr:HIT family protein [Thermoanaerobaculia bacterium]